MAAAGVETRAPPPLSTLQPSTARIGQFWPAPAAAKASTAIPNGPSPQSAALASALEDLLRKGFEALREYELAPDKGVAQLSRADMFFKSVLRLETGEPRATIGVATVHLHRSEFIPALPLLRDVLKRAAAGITADKPLEGSRARNIAYLRQLIGFCFCGMGRYARTRDALVGVTEDDPDNVEALCALALLEGKVSDDGVGLSMEYLDQAVKANKSHPVVLCQLANHAFYCGQAEGDSHGRSASRGRNGSANGQGGESWGMASSLLQPATASARSVPIRAEAHFQLGRLNHAKGQYAEAYEEYSKASLLEPNNLASLFFLGQTCVQQHKYEEAVTHLEAVRSRLSTEPTVLKLLTFAYLQIGNKSKEATKCAAALVKLDNDDLEAWGMRAEACDQLAAQAPKDASRKESLDSYEHFARLLTSKDGNAAAKEMETPQAWNNIGTLRCLQGNSEGAQEAYDKGLELAEQRIKSATVVDNEDLKDLSIARLTLRFNRAWLVESLDQPDYLKATQDYLAIREEHNWYADSLLRVGYLWRRMGDTERAISTYEEASKQSPVLACLMTADTHRQNGNYSKAIEAAETAVRRSTPKQFHYAQVFIGNLHYDAAHAGSSGDKEKNMTKALLHFTKALENEKDSQYAANGIGMVFAERGKLDFAKRTFQSVMQHHAMSDDPSIYINLAHTYASTGGENVRRAISLYERAKKLRPNDLTIRLYLAKAHFQLKEYERCTGILSDGLLVWPDDLLLRYNLAISLENFGVHLVATEKRTKRVVGVDSGVEQMKHAVDLLSSASRMYNYVKDRWSEMLPDEKKVIAQGSGVSIFTEEMARVGLHSQYCEKITQDAKYELEKLDSQRGDLDEKMAKILKEKDLAKAVQQEMEQEKQAADAEVNRDMEEVALSLMESAVGIDLGKDLAGQFDAQKKTMIDKPKVERKVKAPKDVQARMVDCGECEGSGFASLPDGEAPKEDAEREKCKNCEGNGQVPAPTQRAPGRGGAGRKLRKTKKDKKEKKEKKKEKKRRREEGEGSGQEGGNGDEVAARREGGDAEKPATGNENEMEVDDGTGVASFPTGDSDDDKGKKRKKEKKDKKDKKEKKEKKRRKDDSDGAQSNAEAQPTVRDGEQLMEELFGAD